MITLELYNFGFIVFFLGGALGFIMGYALAALEKEDKAKTKTNDR